jgi:hypothetical protein
MKRIPVVMAAVAASAALATAAVGAAGTLPALASSRPQAGYAKAQLVRHQVAPAKAAKAEKAAKARKTGKPAGNADPVKIISQYDSGQYVTVVTCNGATVPGPVQLNHPRTPLRVTGANAAPATVRALAKPRVYKKVYSCTVIVEKKVPAPAGKGGRCELPGVAVSPGKGAGACGEHRVMLNTGFGGMSQPVARHHPAR